MEIKGKVILIEPVQEVSDKFKKREIVIEYAENPSYPEQIKFELQQDKVSLADSIQPGAEVEAHFNLRGRPWTNKEGKTTYFNTLVIWKLTQLAAGAGAPAVAATVQAPAAAAVPAATAAPEDDDLPF